VKPLLAARCAAFAAVVAAAVGMVAVGIPSAVAQDFPGENGLVVHLNPSPLVERKAAGDPGLRLDVDDANPDGVSFSAYLLTGVPADWVVEVGGLVATPSAAGASGSKVYALPKAPATAGHVELLPPKGFIGATKLGLSRTSPDSPNSITALSNGTFDYPGVATPQLDPSVTSYGYRNPTVLSGGEYGPFDGQYTIWPTSRITGPGDGTNGISMVDLRSVDDPMTGYPDLCSAQPSVTTTDSAPAGKLLIINATDALPPPNEFIHVTANLTAGSVYDFSAELANLSMVEVGLGPRPDATFQIIAPDNTVTTLTGSGPIDQDPCASPTWHTFSAVFASLSTGSYTLRLINNAPGGGWNDIGIDNLKLREMTQAHLKAVVHRKPATSPGGNGSDDSGSSGATTPGSGSVLGADSPLEQLKPGLTDEGAPDGGATDGVPGTDGGPIDIDPGLGGGPAPVILRSDPSAPSALTNSLATLRDLRDHPLRIARGFAAGFILLLLGLLVAGFVNRILESRTGSWVRWLANQPVLGRFVRASQSWVDRNPIPSAGLLTGASAVIIAAVDPDFGWDVVTLRLIASAAAAILIGRLASLWIAGLMVPEDRSEPVTLRGIPAGLLLAGVGVLISRALDFQPGFIIGPVFGLLIAGGVKRTVQVERLRAIVALAIAGIAWLASDAIHPTSTLGAFIHDAMVIVVASLLCGTLLRLLPLPAFPGMTLARHATATWLALFFTSAVAFFAIVLPQPGNWLFVGHDLVSRWLILLGLFGLFALGVYLVELRNLRRERKPTPRH
jgi:hypothetical protein